LVVGGLVFLSFKLLLAKEEGERKYQPTQHINKGMRRKATR